ncbi:hypothetical protein LWI29_007952 [Acer saccharum]|uniref:Uncharacterized protein n=1 Tax=Acer saccharum TaxID=4024 RepID=A0AA39T0E3_ACESA|nr:hypothetical protein LWI29_007952 [Acer saccharum]
MYKSTTIATKDPKMMAAAQTPVKIGTRGTVGALIMKEIEYFSRLESSCQQQSSQKPQSHIGDVVSSGSQSSKPAIASVMTTQKKKKKRRGNRLPSICSMVDVSDTNQPAGISRFNYRNLKSDVKKLQA